MKVELMLNEEEVKDLYHWVESGFLTDCKEAETDNIDWMHNWIHVIKKLEKMAYPNIPQ